MQAILKKVIVWAIQKEARLVLKKYKPKIVAITGSVGKTSTKDMIYTVLSGIFFVRKSVKSFNSEIGIPLAILGCPNGWSNPWIWIKNIIEGLLLIIFPNHYPAWLVLEVGADRPGDIKAICEWLKPDVVVVTRLGKIPAHVEFFESTEELFKEKSYLVRALKSDGVLVYNADDEDVVAFRELTTSKAINFGTTKKADLHAAYYKILYESRDETRKPKGITFKIDYAGKNIPVVFNGSLGKQQIYSALAALAVGISQNLNVVDMVGRIARAEGPPGRMRLIQGLQGSLVIDDSYNSSPVALASALETLRLVEFAERKIAVLGDMMELGEFSIEAHKNAGKHAAEVSNIIMTVGIRAQFMAEGALQAGFPAENIYKFDGTKTATDFLLSNLEKNDLILVKGSQSARMEKIVEKIMADRKDAERLIVRQEEEWKKR